MSILPKWKWITKTVQFVCSPDDGLVDFINSYEADGWAVKFLECHIQHPEMAAVHTVVVFEKEVPA